VWRRLKRWGEEGVEGVEGVGEHLWRAALTVLAQHGTRDGSIVFLDGTFVPPEKAGEQVG
jgi:hypothetical protein